MMRRHTGPRASVFSSPHCGSFIELVVLKVNVFSWTMCVCMCVSKLCSKLNYGVRHYRGMTRRICYFIVEVYVYVIIVTVATYSVLSVNSGSRGYLILNLRGELSPYMCSLILFAVLLLRISYNWHIWPHLLFQSISFLPTNNKVQWIFIVEVYI